MQNMGKVVRFDDVCINADMVNHMEIADHFISEGFHVIWAVSPLVHNVKGDRVESQRVFPKILNAYSDFLHFYEVDSCGTIEKHTDKIEIASHGIVHVDHRLLDRSAQEMSIIVSCSLLKAKKFVPPFNKWTKSMQEICDAWGIQLIKFESGWRSMEHNKYDSSHNLWYLHAREWNLGKVKQWLREYELGR